MAGLNRLSAAQVKNAKPGKHCDGGGLYFVKRPDGGGQWVYRYTLNGKQREMGLGSESDLSLKSAREAAEKWRSVRKSGRDPMSVRDSERVETSLATSSLEILAKETFEARKAELKADGKAGRWFSPLELHVLPKLGKMSVQDINQNVIKSAIEPIWHSKSETARKALNRLNLVLEHASAKGLDVDLLAVKKARLLLGKPRQSVRRIPAMDWRDVPEFFGQLDSGSVTHLALRLLILTASRSTPIRFCRLEEIHGDVWTVPADKMKSRKGHAADFRIPLSKAALETIEAAQRHERDGFLFPSQRKGVISDATMAAYMTRNGLEERPHGFRTSFRTWCAEATETPAEIAETALAHVTGNAVERAYRRTDFLERRRLLMEKWARFVCAPQGEVVPLLGGNVASAGK